MKKHAVQMGSAKIVNAELKREILNVIQGDYSALMLFGSYARGDFGKDSDIDVLQVTDEKRRPYRDGSVNVSPYSAASLKYLARHGSLFVLHLVTDGVSLSDKYGLLSAILDEYKSPPNYLYFRKELRFASQLLDCSRGFYHDHWRRLHNVFVFIFRSCCFALCAERGTPKFAMKEVALLLGDSQIDEIYRIKNFTRPEWEFFRNSVSVLGKYLEEPVRNHYQSFEVLLLKGGPQSKLLRILGQRILEPESDEEFYGAEAHPVEDLVCPLP